MLLKALKIVMGIGFLTKTESWQLQLGILMISLQLRMKVTTLEFLIILNAELQIK